LTDQLPGKQVNDAPTASSVAVFDIVVPRILIVDDEPANVLLLERLLRREGYLDIASTTDARQALPLFKEFQPDIVLLDLLMPYLDGFAVMAAIRAAGRAEDYLPILVLTADISRDKKRRALAEGATDFLTKPIDIDEVRLRIKNLLETRRLYQRTQANLAHEREINEIKNRLVSIVSHEFRTPLSTILSSAELLERYGHRWPPEKQGEHFQRIRGAVNQLNQLIQDVLELDKIETIKASLPLHPVDLEALSRRLLEEFRLASGKDHQLDLQTSGIPQLVWTNARLVRHILDNLLSNAIKYSPPGSQVSLSLHWQEQAVNIEVSDAGIGIAPDDLPYLYDTFFRAKNAAPIPGTGLGLSIVKQCVDLLNGLIVCQSTLNQGTTFRVSLPLIRTIQGGEEDA